MTRVARIIAPGIPHHVTQRGNRRQQTFFCDSDYRTYLEFLNISAKTFDLKIWSYCLMPNHVHLLVVPATESSLRNAIGQTHQWYTRLINHRNKWQGHLWQGRFYSFPVEPGLDVITARYIELNPVRAGLCSHPLDYEWSSAKSACHGSKSGLNSFAPLIAPQGSWEDFLCSDISYEKEMSQIRKNTTTGRAFGSPVFITQLEEELGRRITPRKRGPKCDILDENGQPI